MAATRSLNREATPPVRNFLRAYSIEIVLMGVLLSAVFYFAYLGYGLLTLDTSENASGEVALVSVERQLEFGPRTTGSAASQTMSDWLINELRFQGWDVLIQPYELLIPAVSAGPVISPTVTTGPTAAAMVKLTGRNIIASHVAPPSGGALAPVIILAAPYDSRVLADADPDAAKRNEPSPGANAGASGTAVLLEIARILDESDYTICLAFLDSEANRGVAGWQPPFGGERFVEQLGKQIKKCADPRAAMVLDAVGGVDHRIRMEGSSDPRLSEDVWTIADDLGYGEQFVAETGPAVAGPHNVFIESGIPTAAIIESDYPYRNTTADTLDKVSADSLEAVTRTLQEWLKRQ
jgi:hypothetical protein